MKVAITGGTGFVGGSLARSLLEGGHEVVLIARGHDQHNQDLRDLAKCRVFEVSVADADRLAEAFEGCDAVAHCAGINREIGSQRFSTVHVAGTGNVVKAAKRAGVRRIALLSYVGARPDARSGYLTSKWQAEEIVRSSGLDYLVIKAGVIYGRGDHLIDHTAKAMGTFRLYAKIGLSDRIVRPVSVRDVVRVLVAGLIEGQLPCRSVAVVGPEEISFGELARRVARTMEIRPLIVPMPIWFLYIVGLFSERLMKVPLVSLAQVRLLFEAGQRGPRAEAPPTDLEPTTRFTPAIIRGELPDRRRFGLEDLRWSS
jgi:uncharacterized protein YbjT (DUF2867 family)